MPLQSNVATLLREEIGATRSFDVDERVLVDERATHYERVIGQVTLLRTREGVLVAAQLEGRDAASCSRCLRPIDVPVRIEIEEEFYPTVDIRTGAGLPAPTDPDAFRIDAHHVLDLEEAVRQYWAAALPMQPLCRPDCRGLCPRCGADLNEGPCSCPPEVDERWSALRQWAQETKGR